MSETSKYLRENPLGQTVYLLERARAGSDTAWREILRRYHTMLVFHVRASIHGIRTQDLEDLLQTVLSKAVAHLGKFQYTGEGSFRRWLATLVVNECRNELAARAAELRRLGTEPSELTEVPDEAGAASAAAHEERKALVTGLGELEQGDRDLLIMRYFERLSWDAIAEILGCSIEKAKGDYDVAFKRLARRLGASDERV